MWRDLQEPSITKGIASDIREKMFPVEHDTMERSREITLNFSASNASNLMIIREWNDHEILESYELFHKIKDEQQSLYASFNPLRKNIARFV